MKDLLDLRDMPLHAARLKAPTELDAVTKITSLKSPTEVDHYQIQRVIDIYVNPIGEDLGALADRHRPPDRIDDACRPACAWRCAAWCRACARRSEASRSA